MTNQPTKDPFLGATKNACVFYPPTGAYRIFWFQHFFSQRPLPPQIWPQKWPPATPYARKSPQSLPYASSWLQNPRNPHLTRIFRDVCVSKSSRSPPYAATRNFCTLRIFYRTACSIFGTPKFSTCGMSLICGAPKFSIWDMKNFKARPIELFGHLWCSETVSGPYFSRWNWTFTLLLLKLKF